MSLSLVMAYTEHKEPLSNLEESAALVQKESDEVWEAVGVALAGDQTANGLDVEVLTGDVDSQVDTQVLKVWVTHQIGGTSFNVPYIVSYRKKEDETSGLEDSGEAGDDSGDQDDDAEVDRLP